MGSFIKKMRAIFGKEERRVVMIGLDGAGKTTTLCQMKLGETVETQPTVGFNVEKVYYHKTEFTVWDCGGQNKIRPLWRRFFKEADGVVFVIDSADIERLVNGYGSAEDELMHLADEERLEGKPILIFANKQDLPTAVSADEIATRLRLHEVLSKHH